MVEYIPRLLLRRDARLRGQIAGADDVDFAVVEYGSGVAKDEVHAALNVRVKKILAAEIGKQGVLVSEKTAMLEDGTVRSHRDGYRLPGIARGVFKGEVIRLERVAAHLHSRGEEGPACALRILRGRDHDLIRVCSCAQKRGSWPVLGDEHALVINSGGNLYI